jgi:hypothetical protein
MTLIRKLLVGAAAVVAIAVTTEIAHNSGVPGVPGVVSRAEAIVGRPLTPVSVAGVARRTVRRCAVGVYYC